MSDVASFHNLQLASSTLEFALKKGVKTFCLCPGARNAPWVELLDDLAREQSEQIEVLNFFDERQASFFALGRIKRDRRPVAVVTTSGTAVTELYSAVVEAFYTGLPLLLMTADRPKNYRGTGAPQAIDQAEIFGKYAPQSVDLEQGEHPLVLEWNLHAPMQLNVCFSEPLLSGFSEGRTAEISRLLNVGVEMTRGEHLPVPPFPQATDELVRPLIVLGALETEEIRSEVLQFLRGRRIPILAEASSGLRHETTALPGLIQGGETWARRALKTQEVKSVIRLGGVPSFRFWRDLEDLPAVSVWNLSELPFSGLARESTVMLGVAHSLGPLPQTSVRDWEQDAWSRFLNLDQANAQVRHQAIRLFPKSEPSMIAQLASEIPDHACIYLGNSLPIREWNGFVQHRSANWRFQENRGANGIDGQLSTFFGTAQKNQENWGFFGDLTTLYDFTGPWALQYVPGRKIRIVVINNSGGRIFERMFASSRFLTAHQLRFDQWSRIWSLEHTTLGDARSQDVSVVELLPEPEETRRFWEYVEAHCRSE